MKQWCIKLIMEWVSLDNLDEDDLIGAPHVEHSKGQMSVIDDAAGDEDEVEDEEELHDSACVCVGRGVKVPKKNTVLH